MMDAGQSSQISSSSSSSRDLLSPCKGTHTLTVREYEQTIDELKKENFNLKLKLYLFDESMKNSNKDKNNTTSDKEEMVQVIVQLGSESESLRNELSCKNKLLKDAVEQAEKLQLDFNELEKKCAELQCELVSFSELPSKEEYLLFLEDKEQLIKHTESLENIIKEKEEEIDRVNQQIEMLANENRRLEEKNNRRSLAIQGFVYKNFKEKEMLPDELRNIVISATQAAKKRNKEDLTVAVKSFSSALDHIMSTSDMPLIDSEEKENVGSPQVKIMSTSDMPSIQSEDKENIASPHVKCLKDDILEKSSSFLSSHSESPTRIAHIQVRNEP